MKKEEYTELKLHEIASIIGNNWKQINYAAKPYLDAMYTLNNIEDNYYCDAGRSVVAYFLSNAGTWRGEVARGIKLELKKRLKQCRA